MSRRSRRRTVLVTALALVATFILVWAFHPATGAGRGTAPAATAAQSQPDTPRIVGVPKEGETLHCYDGDQDTATTGERVMWQRSRTVAGDGPTLLVTSSMVGDNLRCRIFRNYPTVHDIDSEPVTVEPVDPDRVPPDASVSELTTSPDAGISGKAVCSEACVVDAVALLDPATAKRSGVARTVLPTIVARASSQADANNAATITLKPSADVAAKLRRLGPAPVTIEVRALDRSGNATRVELRSSV